MGFTLAFRHRKQLNDALPIDGNGLPSGTPFLRASDLLFPKSAVVNGCMISPGALLTLNVSAGFVRNAAGAVQEVLPQTAAGATATTANFVAYLVSWNCTTNALVVTAGVDAASLSAAAIPAVPAGDLVVLGSVKIANANTTPLQANIDNLTLRTIY